MQDTNPPRNLILVEYRLDVLNPDAAIIGHYKCSTRMKRFHTKECDGLVSFCNLSLQSIPYRAAPRIRFFVSEVHGLTDERHSGLIVSWAPSP